MTMTQRWNDDLQDLEKRCSRCEEWFVASPENFYRSSNKPDGLVGICKACAREKNKRWRENNPDYFREWKAKNPERRRELDAAYRERNRMKLREKAREYRARNVEARRAYARRYYAANREQVIQRTRTWYRQNQEQALKNKRAYDTAHRDIGDEERAAAGKLLKAYVRLPDGPRGRIVGRRDDLWLVRLYDPIKVGYREYQRIIQAVRVEVEALAS